MSSDLFRNAAKSMLYRLLLHRVPGSFVNESENCWSFSLPRYRHLADSPADAHRSPLLLFEDGRHLGPPHSSRKQIAAVGRGWFSHCDDAVLFSTSDNSDPNTNGRKYSYSVSEWLYRRGSGLPVNFRTREVSSDALQYDVDYAFNGGELYLKTLERDGLSALDGLTIAELGPGINYGTVLYLACHGAYPVVVDPYLAPWDDNYHPQFYRKLREKIRDGDSNVNVSVLSRLIDANDYPDDLLTRYQSPVEVLDAPDESIDVIFSKAVVEHLYDPRAAFSQLSRVTKPGGLGYHWVDFRDHRNFDRPLEFLLISEDDFRREFGLHRGQIGNRLRPRETTELLRACGLEVVGFQSTADVDDPYLAAFEPRLRSATTSPFCERETDELRIVGGEYRLRKPVVDPAGSAV